MRLRKEDKFCIDCGKKGVKERNRCEVCAKEHNRIRSRERTKKYGRHYRMGVCLYCNQPLKMYGKEQRFHIDCYKKLIAENKYDNNKVAAGRYHARMTAISLGLVVGNKNCVHHIDDDPFNNNLNNLILMKREDHTKLHVFLWQERSLWLKGQSKYSENCWDTLRIRLTTAWIEMSGAKVKKLNEIGQSAAEPLKFNNNGEGSEAMHGSPKVL